MSVTVFCTDGVIKKEFAIDDSIGLRQFLESLPRSCYHVEIVRR